MSISIHADDVGLAFGDERIVASATFRISAGAFVSILGPSGCGKTSLLRMVAKLQEPTHGALELDVGNERVARTSFVFQEPTLLPWRSVIDNIRLPLELKGSVRANSLKTAERNAELVGLRPQDLHKYPRMLSGGMRMRVSLARAIVSRPDVLLFDEPFAALDDLLRQRLNEDILHLWQDQLWTALFVTHNVAEAVFLSQRVIVMSDRPSQIRSIVEVPFGYPRSHALRATPEFAQLTGAIGAQLRGMS